MRRWLFAKPREPEFQSSNIATVPVASSTDAPTPYSNSSPPPKPRGIAALISLAWAAIALRSDNPLGKGFLTGAMNENTKLDRTDFRSTLPRFTPEAMKANQAVIDLLASIAQRKQATPAQIALAWLLAQKPWIVPIPGTTKLNRLDENIGAVAVELTTDDLREIENAALKIKVEGARYPEKLEQLTGR